MPDFRVFCASPEAAPAELVLDEHEAHHLVAVNRARLGDPVVAFNGAGREWSCELSAVAKKSARLHVRETRQVHRPAFTITLAQALPKGKCMDAIIRKATEIGAATIVPLTSERSEVQLAGERQESKLEKWRAAAVEAAKQCGNPFLPSITPLQETAAFLQRANSFDLKLLASLQPEARSLKPLLAAFQHQHQRPPRDVLWLVGPEGDFSPAELTLAQTCGFAPVTLGPLVLRCETAAIYALSILNYELLSA